MDELVKQEDRLTKRSFFILAAILAIFCHDGAHAQTVHMGPTSSTFTEGTTTWTPNTCSNWQTFNNPGTFSSAIYNSPAYTRVSGTPIVCTFKLFQGQYRVIIHLIEAVKSFNAPQKRAFSIFMNRDPVLTNVDVFQRAGGVETPYDVSTIAAPDEAGNITISFNQVKSSAMFAGIELIQIPGVLTLFSTDGAALNKVTTLRVGDANIWQLWIGSGNPQLCQATTPDGLAYSASCATPVNQLDRLQILFVNIPSVNLGPVTLSFDGLPAQPLVDRFGAVPPVGTLDPGTYQVWNDGTNWVLFFPLSPLPMNPVAKVWTCNGSGVYPDNIAWDCGGLKLVQIPQPDGSFQNIVGAVSTVTLDSKWSLQ
jgi:hypothetical protein